MPDAHVVREGGGPPLVLIHGVGHYGEAWRPVIDELRGDFDVVAVDSPGFGRSPDLPGDDHSIERYTTFYAELFGELGLDRPHVAGNSMGGAIALELARRGTVRTATAISPVGFGTRREMRYAAAALSFLSSSPEPVFQSLRRVLPSPLGRTAVLGGVIGRPWALPAAEAERTVSGARAAPAMSSALRDIQRYGFRNGHEIEVPVTVAWGRRDILLYEFRQAPRARRALPQARHLRLGGVGHVPFYDDPALVAGAIRRGAADAA